jgi:hypothetical protein
MMAVLATIPHGEYSGIRTHDFLEFFTSPMEECLFGL